MSDQASTLEFVRKIRSEALEQAAQECLRLSEQTSILTTQDNWASACLACAGVIRRLKDSVGV